MWFDTPAYILFLILVVTIYWRLGRKGQNLFLLAASYVFYGWWDYRFLLLMIGSTTIDFFIARAIARTTNLSTRRTLLVVSLIINFGILGVFKYFNFFVDSSMHVFNTFGFRVSRHFLRIILPPGISFYTFQEVAYIVDVYKGKIRSAESFIDYALFISLFPHLIAGPIQRPSHLLPQVQNDRKFGEERFFDGIMLILSGLFRKCVIADNCALLANAAFSGNFGTPNLAVLAVGSYAFAWQIYGDFSGYSDIARGSAQLLGFHFMVNFRQPYLATSLQDFWRRWHISLSTWLRDYLYIPLGGSRHGERATYRNLFITMLLGGLWHGANWTFVLWGALHGVGLAIERAWGLVRSVTAVWRAPRRRTDQSSEREALASTSRGAAWTRRILVFHFVCFGWILFRATSIGAAWQYLGQFAHWAWRPTYVAALSYLAIFTIPLFLIDLRLEHTGEEYLFQTGRYRWQVAAAAAAVIAVAMLSQGESTAFIYFQF